MHSIVDGRWIIFHFDKKFQYGSEDTKLIEKITTPEELSGLLNLACPF
jgi:hypothetical protein